jgi:hypothetical protein
MIAAMQARRFRGPFGRSMANYRGDPGLLGSIGKVLGKALPIAKVIPGVGNVLSAVSLGSAAIGAVKSIKGASQAVNASKALVPISQVPGNIPRIGGLGKALTLGAGAAALGAGGAALVNRMGGTGRRYRRMNPLNPKAANRAIRRIKAVRKLCRSIESSLPKQRTASCGTRGRKR